MKKNLLLCAAMMLSAPVFAVDGITLGEPGYGGTGCPSGSVSATLSPDATSLSLLFDKYQVAVGGTTGESFDRKSCNIAIPVRVPQGFSVSIHEKWTTVALINYHKPQARSSTSNTSLRAREVQLFNEDLAAPCNQII